MNTPIPCIKQKSRQRGLAAVETVIILPILLLLMLGTAELGRAFYLSNSLAKMVRDGARHMSANATKGDTGIIDPTDADYINAESVTKNLIVYGTPGGTGNVLLPDFLTADVTVTVVDPVHVQVSAVYNFTPIFATIPTFGFGADIQINFPLTATVTMRAL